MCRKYTRRQCGHNGPECVQSHTGASLIETKVVSPSLNAVSAPEQAEQTGLLCGADLPSVSCPYDDDDDDDDNNNDDNKDDSARQHGAWSSQWQAEADQLVGNTSS